MTDKQSVIEINPEILLDRLYDELCPSPEYLATLGPDYVKALHDCERVIKKVQAEREAELDEMMRELKAMGKIPGIADLQ